MNVAVIVEGVVILALVVALVLRQREAEALMRDLSAEAMRERGVLLDRIQRPDILPRAPRLVQQSEPPADVANLRKVGTIDRDAPKEPVA
jgi:hypothetical protein